MDVSVEVSDVTSIVDNVVIPGVVPMDVSVEVSDVTPIVDKNIIPEDVSDVVLIVDKVVYLQLCQ